MFPPFQLQSQCKQIIAKTNWAWNDFESLRLLISQIITKSPPSGESRTRKINKTLKTKWRVGVFILRSKLRFSESGNKNIMALKLNTKVLVSQNPEENGTNSENVTGDFRKHLYNQTAVSGW